VAAAKSNELHWSSKELLKIEDDQKPFESDEAKSSDEESEYDEEEVTDSEEEAMPRLKPVFVQKYFKNSNYSPFPKALILIQTSYFLEKTV
jgi:hypothetical protein